MIGISIKLIDSIDLLQSERGTFMTKASQKFKEKIKKVRKKIDIIMFDVYNFM